MPVCSLLAFGEYYHQQLAPSSDVDLFIWGLDEAAAFEKIKQIESHIRNAILEEVTVSLKYTAAIHSILTPNPDCTD